MSQRPMFPHTIDSTMLAAFHACPQKFFRQYVQHWKSRSSSIHLTAGGAFAAGIEVARRAFYEKNLPADDAVALGMTELIKVYGDAECPPSIAKTLDRMIGALEFYFDRYPLGADGATPVHFADGKLGIEFSFAEPLPIAHPVTGDPILYTGRSDMIAERAGSVYVYDEKTTSSLGLSWARQWEMRAQFTGYIWAASKQGLKVSGAMVRGISILKTKYDTLEVPTYRSKHEVRQWLTQTCKDIERMIRCWNEGYWDYNLDGACTDYGGCAFVPVCKHSDPDSQLPIMFKQAVWDPLARQELTPAQHEASWHKGDMSGMDGELASLLGGM